MAHAIIDNRTFRLRPGAQIKKGRALVLFMILLILSTFSPNKANAQLIAFVVEGAGAIDVIANGVKVYRFGSNIILGGLLNQNLTYFQDGGSDFPWILQTAVVNADVGRELYFQWRMLDYLREAKGYNESDRQYFNLTQSLGAQTQAYDRFNLLTRKETRDNLYRSILQQRPQFVSMRDRNPANDRQIAESCTNAIGRNSSIPSGYGSAFNVHDNAKSPLFEAVCSSKTSVQIVAGHNYNSPQQITYQSGWRWDGQRWRPFNFTGAEKNGVWFFGRASAELDADLLDTSGGENWILAYTCSWQEREWRCGCRDRACARPFWQLQKFQFR